MQEVTCFVPGRDLELIATVCWLSTSHSLASTEVSRETRGPLVGLAGGRGVCGQATLKRSARLAGAVDEMEPLREIAVGSRQEGER